MFGHYRTMNNRVHCVMQKAKTPAPSNKRLSLRQRKAIRHHTQFEAPEQDFHMDLEIKGKKNLQLHWFCYTVISKYKNGHEQLSDFDVTNTNNYPTMYFSRVKSYNSETTQPLM